jgi:hypothetical protein
MTESRSREQRKKTIFELKPLIDAEAFSTATKQQKNSLDLN